jgi:hypothetical protein
MSSGGDGGIMRHQSKVKRLEQAAEAQAPKLPWMGVTQSLDDPNLYSDKDGNVYTDAELDALSQTHNILRIVYVKNWRDDDATHISLQWPED